MQPTITEPEGTAGTTPEPTVIQPSFDTVQPPRQTQPEPTAPAEATPGPTPVAPAIITPETEQSAVPEVEKSEVAPEPLTAAPEQPISVIDPAPAPAPEAAPQTHADVAAKQPGHMLRNVIEVLILVAIFVAGYLASLGVTHVSQADASSQAKAFITALNKGDYAKAYSLGSTNLHKQQTADQFKSNIGNVSDAKPSFTDEAVAFNGKAATYVVTENGLPATEDGNTQGTFTISLVKSGLLGWKIDSASVN